MRLSADQSFVNHRIEHLYLLQEEEVEEEEEKKEEKKEAEKARRDMELQAKPSTHDATINPRFECVYETNPDPVFNC